MAADRRAVPRHVCWTVPADLVRVRGDWCGMPAAGPDEDLGQTCRIGTIPSEVVMGPEFVLSKPGDRSEAWQES